MSKGRLLSGPQPAAFRSEFRVSPVWHGGRSLSSPTTVCHTTGLAPESRLTLPPFAMNRFAHRFAPVIVAVISLLGLSGAVGRHAVAQDSPRSLDPRIKIELFAENPQIVTPTGIDVDHRGRVFAVESNTHFPPQAYAGHATDRVRILESSSGAGPAHRVVTFADGFRHTMSVLVLPPWQHERVGLKPTKSRKEQAVLLATRRAIWLLHDDDGDDRADRWVEIVKLETKGDYPHNGLAGFALHATNWLYFGLGENLGAPYTLVGSDGKSFQGGGEGGNVYRCRLDGAELELVSTGYWNPHASALDAFGRLFTVDNDPDSRPPCRLMHVTPGSDFGYRFRNGRKGLHPFSAWNGELPGTLPMVAGTGEAPSGIVAYEAGSLPAEFQGNLLVTSWGDHRIDRFVLKPRGSSFQSLAEPLITGGAGFRPVGLACGPDGSLYCTDWVLQDYTLHLRGRIWRISGVEAAKEPPLDIAALPEKSSKELVSLLSAARIEARRAAARELVVSADGRRELREILLNSAAPQRARHEAAWALAQSSEADPLSATEQDQLLKPGSGVAGVVIGLMGSKWLPESPERAGRLSRLLLNDRLSGRTTAGSDPADLIPALLHSKLADREFITLALSVEDPYILGTMVTLMARDLSPDGLAAILTPGSLRSARARVAALLAARRQAPHAESIVELGLADPDPEVRRGAVQWVAEERLIRQRPGVEAVFHSDAVTSDLFVASLAALEMLDGVSPADIDKTPASQYVMPLLADAQRPVGVRVQALRLVSPAATALTKELFDSLWDSGDASLRLEALRTWQGSRGAQIEPQLLALAGDSAGNPDFRLEAVLALESLAAASADSKTVRGHLVKLLRDESPAIVTEALRGLRAVPTPQGEVIAAVESLAARLAKIEGEPGATDRALADQVALALAGWRLPVPEVVERLSTARPRSTEEWVTNLSRGRAADPEAGRRVFYSPAGPGCSKCHTVNGRGGKVGPDLSRVADTMNRLQLIQSILDPSGEIAPQFVAWTMETREGKAVTGMVVHENEGKTILGTGEGETVELKTSDIIDRVPQRVSVMPEKLVDRMTVQDVRDVLAFLEGKKH